ncbi:MAG: GNAT family N-acetyltransferase [Lentisphaeraceae bacterium]|nr:GNAT family N-acetyltransferase [Lentisphaeraceae bacterium]
MEDEIVIRRATLSDVLLIHRLIQSYPHELILRPVNNIVENIDRFTVALRGRELIACACWQILPEIGCPEGATVELQSVAVSKAYRGQGIGSRLIKFVLQRISGFKPAQAIVLTFEPDFFGHLGFKKIEKTQIIHKIYRGCIYCTKHTNPFTCPEIAMALPMA